MPLRSLTLNSLLGSSSVSSNETHGLIKVIQRPRAPWANEEHHSHGVLTGNRNGFVNPWKSFHKPTLWEIAANATLKRVEEKAHAVDERDPVEVAEESLEVVTPSWGGPWDASKSVGRVRATWLGHAGALLQFPPHPDSDRSTGLNVIVDPIFSSRSSPAQTAGPTRIVKSPCTVADLPPIHVVVISHNHYDHLDLATLTGIYKKEKENVHFFAPLGGKTFLTSQGIPAGQVTEADWWDEFNLTFSPPETGKRDASLLRVICTPAQHNSGRWGGDSNSSLWSSWYFQSFADADSAAVEGSEPSIRAYFAGDTGLRYRDSKVQGEDWETCPAFREIAERLGTPDVSLLPISVGGTLTYVRSWDPAPAGFSLVPEIPEALTSSTHMSPGDAVDLHKLLLGSDPTHVNQGAPALPGRKRMISLGVHFGTFCSGPAESRDTVRTLRRECKEKGVEFAKRSGEQSVFEAGQDSAFVIVDHGGTIEIATQ